MASKNGVRGKAQKKGPAPISKEAPGTRLLSTWVPIEVYDEVSRRAASERRSLSQFLALFLEQHLCHVTIEGKKYPVARDVVEDD